MTCISTIPRTRFRTLISLHSRCGSGWSAAIADRHGCTLRSFTFDIFSHYVHHTCSPHTTPHISNGNANGPFRNDFTSPVYLICIIFLEVSTIFLFNYEKREIEKRTKMKTCINISFPSKVRFRKKVHSQASDHVWFFLNLFSKRPREKREKKSKKRKNTY